MTVLALSDVPLTESLADTRDRVGSLWTDELLPQIVGGKNLLVVGHANCLRALISCIQGNLKDEHLPSLGVPNALPLVYEFDASGAPVAELPDRCFIRPLDAYYLARRACYSMRWTPTGRARWMRPSLTTASSARCPSTTSTTSTSLACSRARQLRERLMLEPDNNNDGAVDFNST